jgi:hypothetical protein|tara:strand:- start:967 stop:1143 length:177 start_codon:yes stop_codon:yes gene_type:complete
MGTVEWALVLALSNGGVWDSEFRYGTSKECYDAGAVAEQLLEDSKVMCVPIKANSDTD